MGVSQNTETSETLEENDRTWQVHASLQCNQRFAKGRRLQTKASQASLPSYRPYCTPSQASWLTPAQMFSLHRLKAPRRMRPLFLPFAPHAMSVGLCAAMVVVGCL